eukprot:gene20427-22440_t
MPAGKRKLKQEKPKKESEKPVAKKAKPRRVSHPSYEEQTNGIVLTMGQGDVGQLGMGEDIMEKKKPGIVPNLDGVDMVQICCGGMHTVALSSDGKLYTWGCNDEGALCRATSEEDADEYNAVCADLNLNSKIVQASAGDSHTAVLLENGDVYACGTFRDMNGAIGLTPKGQSKEPVKVYPTSNSDDRAIKITSGNDHVVILTETGHIFTFGSGEQGQLGRVKECFSHRGGRRGLSMLLVPQIVRFKKKQKFKDIFSGSFHTFAIADGEDDVYAWGLNNWGQLGTGDTYSYFSPTVVESLSKLRKDAGDSLSLSGGQHHSIIVDGKGLVHCVGRSEYGRLGHGEEATELSIPKQVDSLKKHHVKVVASGEATSFAITDNGDLFSWGLGSSLQLGNGEEDDVLVPTQVKGKNIDPSKHEVLGVSSGGQHTALILRQRKE